MSELMLDVGQANELKLAFRRADFISADVKQLCEGDILKGVRKLLRGEAQIVDVDPKGKVVWRISNDDFPEKPFADPCGGQRLPKGNTVIASSPTDEIKQNQLL